jgi:prepilin-type N-terminal cleavage/methylation domain-containing protein
MKRLHIRSERGDSLIEVLIALSLIAITSLGLIAVQSALARGERMALLRERATLIADSVAEGIRSEADRVFVVSQWQARAAVTLPAGNVAVLDRADNVRVAVVSWHAEDNAEPCPEPQAGVSKSCIAIAFAR